MVWKAGRYHRLLFLAFCRLSSSVSRRLALAQAGLLICSPEWDLPGGCTHVTKSNVELAAGAACRVLVSWWWYFGSSKSGTYGHEYHCRSLAVLPDRQLDDAVMPPDWYFRYHVPTVGYVGQRTKFAVVIPHGIFRMAGLYQFLAPSRVDGRISPRRTECYDATCRITQKLSIEDNIQRRISHPSIG